MYRKMILIFLMLNNYRIYADNISSEFCWSIPSDKQTYSENPVKLFVDSNENHLFMYYALNPLLSGYLIGIVDIKEKKILDWIDAPKFTHVLPFQDRFLCVTKDGDGGGEYSGYILNLSTLEKEQSLISGRFLSKNISPYIVVIKNNKDIWILDQKHKSEYLLSYDRYKIDYLEKVLVTQDGLVLCGYVNGDDYSELTLKDIEDKLNNQNTLGSKGYKTFQFWSVPEMEKKKEYHNINIQRPLISTKNNACYLGNGFCAIQYSPGFWKVCSSKDGRLLYEIGKELTIQKQREYLKRGSSPLRIISSTNEIYLEKCPVLLMIDEYNTVYSYDKSTGKLKFKKKISLKEDWIPYVTVIDGEWFIVIAVRQINCIKIELLSLSTKNIISTNIRIDVDEEDLLESVLYFNDNHLYYVKDNCLYKIDVMEKDSDKETKG